MKEIARFLNGTLSAKNQSFKKGGGLNLLSLSHLAINESRDRATPNKLNLIKRWNK